MDLGTIKIEATVGDITKQADMTAIVNPTNAQLQIGEGVSGAIHTAAGLGLAEECQPLAPIRTAEAVITGAYHLPNEFIIHVLGPVYGFNHPEMNFLSKSYMNALDLAENNKVDSIAFPAISTGEFGYPFHEAIEIAISAIKDFSLTAKFIKHIRFVLVNDKDYEQYKEKLSEIL